MSEGVLAASGFSLETSSQWKFSSQKGMKNK